MSLVLLSVKLRIAESLLGVAAPIVTEEFAGEMTKPVGTGGPMLNDMLPVAAPDAADTVATPCLRVVSSPVGLIVARAASDVDQLTVASGFVVPSEKFPVAVNCWVSPAGTEAFCDVTVIDWRVTGRGPTPLLPPPHAIRVAAAPSTPEHANRDKRLHFRGSTGLPRATCSPLPVVNSNTAYSRTEYES